MTTRTCRNCGAALAADAHSLRKYCTPKCRYQLRDAGRDWSTPEIREADNRRHRERYAARHDRPIRAYRRKDQP